MSSQASALGLQSSVATLHHRRVARTASENPCDDDHQDHAKRYHAGAQIKSGRCSHLWNRLCSRSQRAVTDSRVAHDCQLARREPRGEWPSRFFSVQPR
jgi:hypothetical protein